MTTEGRPACTIVGILHAHEVVIFLVLLDGRLFEILRGTYLLDPYVVHPAKMFPSHQKLLYLGNFSDNHDAGHEVNYIPAMVPL